MNPKRDDDEVRCSHCSALLAKHEPAGMTIRRGDLEAVLSGTFRVTLRCYRPYCRQRTVVDHSDRGPQGTGNPPRSEPRAASLSPNN